MTLKDVAALANCSVATVCKVFKNSEEISPQTKERVVAAAKKCGYLKKATTRTAVLGGLKVVLLSDPLQKILPELPTLQKQLAQAGYTAVYTALESAEALKLMRQIGAVALACFGPCSLPENNIYKANETFEVAEFCAFLNGLGGVARATRKSAEKPAQPHRKEEKQSQPTQATKHRDEIWLL